MMLNDVIILFIAKFLKVVKNVKEYTTKILHSQCFKVANILITEILSYSVSES